MNRDLVTAAIAALALHGAALIAIVRAPAPVRLEMASDPGPTVVRLAAPPAPGDRVRARPEPIAEPTLEDTIAQVLDVARSAPTERGALAPEPAAIVAVPVAAPPAVRPVPERLAWQALAFPDAPPRAMLPPEPGPPAPPAPPSSTPVPAAAMPSAPSGAPVSPPATAEPGDAAPARDPGGPSVGPVAIRNTPPGYPRVARQRGWEGVVELWVQVTSAGAVGEVRVQRSSGYGVLDRAALSAVRRWRFRPATRDGVAEQTWIAVPVEFGIEE